MINYIEKYSPSLYCILGFFCMLLFWFQRIPGCSLKIGTAMPLVLLSAVITIACFLREWAGFWFGLFCGIALDSVLLGSYCFYTLSLAFIGVLSGLTFRFFMNRNIKAVIIAGTLFSLLFFVLKWLFLRVIKGDASLLLFLLKYDIPSALYSAVFIIPLFYFVRHISKKHIVE